MEDIRHLRVPYSFGKEEEYMKQSEKMQKVLQELEKGVEEFFLSDKYIQYLNVMSRFHTYSVNNQILIAMQNPEATHVAGYSSWMNNFKRYVKRDEKAITILAPMKQLVEVETDQADEFGNAIMEKRERISFRPVSVFDVSQTSGEPLPELISELNGEVDNYNTIFDAIKAVAPFHIDIRQVDSSAKGWCDYTSEVIVIKAGMSEIQNIKTAIHETAHGRIHSINDGKSRAQKEVEAESIAFVVSNHFGIDTSDYSFGYVAGWASNQTHDVLKECMKTIREESKNLIDALEMEIQEPGQFLKKEQRLSLQENVKEKMLNQGIVGDVAIVNADENRVTVMAVYKDEMPALELKNSLDQELKKNEFGISEKSTLSIVPVNISEKQTELDITEKMTDTSWPMVTILSQNNVQWLYTGRYMTLYEAVMAIRKADNAMTLSEEKGTLKIAIEFTYLGHPYKIHDSFSVGEGKKNFIDYLDISSDICTYLKRHVQIMDVCEKCRGVNAVGKIGHIRQMKYEDMIYEWAEQMRMQLNYKQNPEIRKPPEFNPDIVKQYDSWEVTR